MINQFAEVKENPEPFEIQITDQHSIEEAFHVLKENRNWSESTQNNYAHDIHIFESFLCEQGYDPLLKNVKFHFVTKWIREQQKDNLSVGTIQRLIAAMSSLFSFYLNLGIVHTNPFKAVEKPEGSSSYDSALMEMDDLKKMFFIVDDLKKQGLDIEVTTKVMFYSGLRNSALSQLKVKDVLFEQALLQKTNDIENSKNKYQFLPIPPKLLLLLQNHIQKNLLKPEDTLLFGLRGDPLHAKQLNRLTNRLNKALDWTEKNRITPHGFRSSLATLLSERGIDIKAIKLILGHSDADIDYHASVRIYIRNNKRMIHLIQKELTSIEEEIDQFVQSPQSIKEIAQSNKQTSLVLESTKDSNSLDEEMLLKLMETHPKLALSIIKENGFIVEKIELPDKVAHLILKSERIDYFLFFMKVHMCIYTCCC